MPDLGKGDVNDIVLGIQLEVPADDEGLEQIEVEVRIVALRNKTFEELGIGVSHQRPE